MNTETQSLGSRPAGRLKKTILWLLTITAAIILLLFFIVPAYLSSGSGTNMVIGKINKSIDGKVEMEDLSMGWFSGIKLTDLSFADNAGTVSVNIREITTRPKYGSLLRGQMALGKTVIDGPDVEINIEPPKKTTPGVISRPRTKTVKQKTPPPIPLGDMDLEVKRGNVVINLSAEGKKQTVHFKDIASKFDIKSPGSKSTFDLALAVVGQDQQSKISASGNVTPPKKGWTLKGTSGDFTVKIDDLDLATLKPLLALTGQQGDIAGRLNADMVANLDDGKFKELKADAVLTGFKHIADGKEMVLTEPVKIDAKISSVRDEMKIDRLKVDSSFCKIDCTGDADVVDYTAQADLKGLHDFTGQFTDFGGYGFGGKLIASGKVTLGDRINASGKYNVTGLVLNNTKTGKKTSPTDIAVSGGILVDKKKETIGFESFKVISNPAQLQLSGSISKQKNGKSALKASGNVDLQKLQPFLDVTGALPEGMTIGGKAQTVVSIDIDRGRYHIVTDDTNVKNLMIKKAGQQEAFQEPELKLSADIIADTKDKSIEVRDLKVDATSIKIIKGKLNQSSKAGRTKLKGQLEAQYDLAKLSTMATAFIPEQLKMEGNRNAVLNFASSFPTEQSDKMLANMDADLAFGFDSAEYMGLNIGKADLNVNMQKGLLTVKPFSATANKGTLNFGGSADFNQTPVMFNIPAPMQVIDKVQIDDEMTRKMLTYVNPIFAKAVNVSGIANLHCDKLAIPLKGGNKNDALVAGTIGFSDIRMSEGGVLGQILSIKGGMGQNMEIVPTEFTLQKGIVKYDDMQLNIGDNPVNFRGQIGLDDTIDMTVLLPYTSEGRTVRIGEESTSTRLVVAIEGTASNPSINVGNLLQKQVEELLKKEGQKLLEEGLKGLFE